MTRSELIQRLADRLAGLDRGQGSELGPRDCEVSVRVLLDAMTQSLANGQRIEIRGFGTFSVNSRATYQNLCSVKPNIGLRVVNATAVLFNSLIGCFVTHWMLLAEGCAFKLMKVGCQCSGLGSCERCFIGQPKRR